MRRTLSAAVVVLVLALVPVFIGAPPARADVVATPRTSCNPIDLDHRFMAEPPSRREAGPR
jgi:hypothetical protein